MKRYLLLVLVAIFSVTGLLAQGWSVTLNSADGLPGDPEAYYGEQYYRFASEKFTPGVSVDRIRLTVTGTVSNEAPNGNNIIFALSGLTVYDGDGNEVGYIASSNADHNSLSYQQDGDGLPALSDDDIKSFFHSLWTYPGVQDYHYIELALTRSVDSFSIEWTTRLGESKNNPTAVGITLGTDYVPASERDDFSLGSSVTKESELAAANQLFVLRGNAVKSFTASNGTTYWGSGPLYMLYAEEGDVTPSMQHVMQLIPCGDGCYLVYWPVSGKYLANSAGQFNGLNGWQYSTNSFMDAARVNFTAIGDGYFEMKYDGANSAGDLILYVGAELRDGVNSKMKIFDLAHKQALERGDYTQGFSLPVAFNWSVYKANVSNESLNEFYVTLAQLAANYLRPIINKANNYFARYGNHNGYCTDGEDTSLDAAIVTATNELSSISSMSRIEELEDLILESLSRYMAVGLVKYEERVNELLATSTFSSYPYKPGTYPVSSKSVLESIKSTIAVAKEKAGVYSAEQYEAVFAQAESDIEMFLATKIEGEVTPDEGGDDSDEEPADGEVVYVYLKNGGIDAFAISSIDGEYYIENNILYFPIKDGDVVYYAAEEYDSCSMVRPQLPSMTSFKFNNKYNPNLNVDAIADTVTSNMHFSLNSIGKWLTASFQLSDDKAVAFVDTVLQESKVTRQSFADRVTYKVTYPGYNIVERVKVQDEIWYTPSVEGEVVEVALTADMLSTNKPSTQLNEGLGNLLDGNPNTIFHSTWGSANNATLNVNTYIDIDLPESLEDIQLYYRCRPQSGYNPLVWEIYVSNDGNMWTLVRTLDYRQDSMPSGGAGQEYTSPTISLGGSYSKLRILQTSGEYSKNHFVLSELRVYKVTEGSTGESEKIQDAIYENRYRPFGREYNVDIEWLTDNAVSVPRIDIDIEGGKFVTSKTTYLDANFRITGYGVYDNFEDSVQIKGRGNSTWSYSKKPYRLKFAEKVKPFGLTKGKSWVLLANAQSGSLMANAIAMKIGQMAGAHYTNHIIPVELYMNGQYMGSYMFTEKVGMANNSVDIDEELGYLLELDTYGSTDEPIYRTGLYSLPVKIAEPDLEDYTADVKEARRTAMLNDVKAMSSEIYYGGDLESVLDVDGTARFYLANDLVLNQEINHPKSTFLYRNEGEAGRLTFGPLWDFDWAFGYESSSSYCYYNSTGNLIKTSMESYDFWQDMTSLEVFRKHYYKVWKEFVDKNSMAELNDYIDSYYNFAKNSFQNNANEWGYSNGFTESDATRAKQWLAERMNHIYNNLAEYNLDEFIYALRGDVNRNNQLTVHDVALVVAYLKNDIHESFNEAKADLDADGTINLDDASGIAELLFESDAPSAMYWHKTPLAGNMSAGRAVSDTDGNIRLPLKFTTASGCQLKAFQFEFEVPDNSFLFDIEAASSLAGYNIELCETAMNNYRVIAYNEDNSAVDASSIQLDIILVPMGEVSGQVNVKNTYAVNAGNSEVRFSDLTAILDGSGDDALDGDINGDGRVSVSDIQVLVNLILADATASDNPAADLNGDGRISISDIQIVVNRILNVGNTAAARSASRAGAQGAADSRLYIEPFSINPGEKKTIDVILDNPGDEFSAIQFDLRLPDGIEVVCDDEGFDIGLGSRTTYGRHNVPVAAMLADGSLRVICYSGNGDNFIGKSGGVMSIAVRAADDIADGLYDLSIGNAELARANATACRQGATSSTITVGSGFTNIVSMPAGSEVSGIYDLMGRRIEKITAPGVYVIDGKKTLVK